MNYTTETLMFVLKRMLALLHDSIDSIDRYSIKDVVCSINRRLAAGEHLVDICKREDSSVQDFEQALDRWDKS